tara:strand:- start:124 stop:696 length:573 start_codon:yes stop_codon:yes gene_type:complete
MKYYLSVFIFIISTNISLCSGISFDPLHLKDKNRSSIERAGDFLQIGLPLFGLGISKYKDDSDGTSQFWKSFLYANLTTSLLKIIVDKERPNGHCCESFPSGHTTAAFSGAMFIHQRYGDKYGIPSLLLASFVGYSRVYAKKHYWIDVFCGATIGILSNIILTEKSDITLNNFSFLKTNNGFQLYIRYPL